MHELKREDLADRPDVLSQLMAHDWPGNVRELRNVVERGLSLEGGALPIEVSGDVGTRDQRRRDNYQPGGMSQGRAREAVQGGQGRCSSSRSSASTSTHLLQRHNGNISRAALEAGIDRNYIHRLVKKYNIPVERG